MRKIILTMILVTVSLYAEISVKDYKEFKKDGTINQSFFKMYIKGLGKGFAWSNTMNKEYYKKSLYCSPKNIALNVNNYLDILDNQLESYDIEESFPIELLILKGLTVTFPCEDK